MTRLFTWLVGIGLLGAMSVASAQDAGNPRDPELNFEYVWKAMDRTYPQFGVRHVDWDALCRVYRLEVTPATTDEELWDILLTMLQHLNDSHVCLADGTRRNCGGLTEGLKPDDFFLDLIKSKYLQGKFTDALDGSFTSGWLTDGIGYVHIGDFKHAVEPTTQAIDAFMSELAQARALVVDVRGNPGGNARVVELVTNRFAGRKRHYMRVLTRYGPRHDDLSPVDDRNVEPGGPIQFRGPTVLLTHRLSASGADNFAPAMHVLPHVTVVGDPTEGAFAAQFPDRMPNGWVLWVAFKTATDHNGVRYDGLGVPPDLRIWNTPQNIAAGTDRARAAVRKARLGSAADVVSQALTEGDFAAGEKAFQELLSRWDTRPVFDEDDFNNLGYRLLQEGNLGAAVYVFEKNAELNPESWNAHDSLGEALVQAGQRERAIESYRGSLELNPRNTGGREMLKRLEDGQ
jgi:tetratricopeptide (TPR) repeat protein